MAKAPSNLSITDFTGIGGYGAKNVSCVGCEAKYARATWTSVGGNVWCEMPVRNANDRRMQVPTEPDSRRQVSQMKRGSQPAHRLFHRVEREVATRLATAARS